MASQQVMRRCKSCGTTTMHIQKTTNHILHLLLSIVTAGAWIIVWLIVSSVPSYPKCSVCGRAWYPIDLRRA